MSTNNEKLRVIQGGKDTALDHAPGLRPTVHERSEIKEDKVFSKKEVAELIAQIARAEGFNQEDFYITKEEYDKGGKLVILCADIKPEKIGVEGRRRVEYSYIIKGIHDGSFSDTTIIVRVFGDAEHDTDAEAGVVAEYTNGKWLIDPGNITRMADFVRPVSSPQKTSLDKPR